MLSSSTCLGLPSYAIVGTLEDLYRLFQLPAIPSMRRLKYYACDGLNGRHGASASSNTYSLIVHLLYKKFDPLWFARARAKAEASPHFVYWEQKNLNH